MPQSLVSVFSSSREPFSLNATVSFLSPPYHNPFDEIYFLSLYLFVCQDPLKKTTTPESPFATPHWIHASLYRGKRYPEGRRDDAHLNHHLQLLLEFMPLCLRGKWFPAGTRDDVSSWGTCDTLTGRKCAWKLLLKAQRNSFEEGWRKVSRRRKEKV